MGICLIQECWEGFFNWFVQSKNPNGADAKTAIKGMTRNGYGGKFREIIIFCILGKVF